MSITRWLQPPRHVLAIFLTIMLVSAGALGWLGWQLLEQDRSLERQRLQERLEQAADQTVAALQRSLSELEAHLNLIPSAGATEPPRGVAILLIKEQAVEVYPSGSLLYYPAIPPDEEPPAATFAEGENLEYQRNDPAKAAEFFRALARSSSRAVRAGALL